MSDLRCVELIDQNNSTNVVYTNCQDKNLCGQTLKWGSLDHEYDVKCGDAFKSVISLTVATATAFYLAMWINIKSVYSRTKLKENQSVIFNTKNLL